MLDIVKEFAIWFGYLFLFLIFYSIFIQNKKYKLLKMIVLIVCIFPFLDLIFLKTIKTYYQLTGPIKTYNSPIINDINRISSIHIPNSISLSNLIKEKRISNVHSLRAKTNNDEVYLINEQTKKWEIFDKKSITEEEILPLLDFTKFKKNFEFHKKVNDFVDIKIYDNLKYTKNQFIYIRVNLHDETNHFILQTNSDIVPKYKFKGEDIEILNKMIRKQTYMYIDSQSNEKIIEINESIYFRNNNFFATIREDILHLTRKRGRLNIPIFKIETIRNSEEELLNSFFKLF